MMLPTLHCASWKKIVFREPCLQQVLRRKVLIVAKGCVTKNYVLISEAIEAESNLRYSKYSGTTALEQ